MEESGKTKKKLLWKILIPVLAVIVIAAGIGTWYFVANYDDIMYYRAINSVNQSFEDYEKRQEGREQAKEYLEKAADASDIYEMRTYIKKAAESAFGTSDFLQILSENEIENLKQKSADLEAEYEELDEKSENLSGDAYKKNLEEQNKILTESMKIDYILVYNNAA